MPAVTRATIDTALANLSSRAFPPALEACYEADGGVRRRRQLSVTLVVAAGSIIAAIILDRPRTAAVLLDRL